MRPGNMLRSVPPVWVLLLLSAALWGGEFVRRGLWEPDEARYAYVASEMRAEAHWFVPHINGALYPDKPPLMFWLINASTPLTGGHINGVSARLPSLLGVVLTLWVITRLLARWHSTEAAWRALLILMTTYMFWHQGGWAQIDALLCGLVMMSVYSFFASLEDRRLWRESLAYTFAGLAVLAKGPVGLLVPMGIFALGVAASGEARKLKRFHWLWGPLLASAIPAVWLLLAWLQDTPIAYFASLFGEKSFSRAVQATGHGRPFYFFLLHFPLEALPWTIFAPAALVALSDKPLKRRLLGWILFVLVTFSLFVCKRNLYILAAYPGLAMLIGAAWGDIQRLSRRWKAATAYVGAGLLWLLAVGLTIGIFVPQVPFSTLALVPTACVLLLGALLMTRLTRRDPLSQTWFFAFCGVFFLFQATVGAVVLPAMNKIKGPVDAAKIARAELEPGDPIYLYAQQLAIFPLYAESTGRQIHTVDELMSVLTRNPHAIIVFQARHWQELEPEIGTVVSVLKEFNMGSKRLVLVGGRP